MCVCAHASIYIIRERISDVKIYVFRLVVSKIVRFYALNPFAGSEMSKIKTMIYASICFTP